MPHSSEKCKERQKMAIQFQLAFFFPDEAKLIENCKVLIVQIVKKLQELKWNFTWTKGTKGKTYPQEKLLII